VGEYRCKWLWRSTAVPGWGWKRRMIVGEYSSTWVGMEEENDSVGVQQYLGGDGRGVSVVEVVAVLLILSLETFLILLLNQQHEKSILVVEILIN
jgi:hypothetical protein